MNMLQSQAGVIAVTSVIQLTIHNLIAHVYSHAPVTILIISALMLLSYVKTLVDLRKLVINVILMIVALEKLKNYDTCFFNYMYATHDGRYCCKYDPNKPGHPQCDENDPTVMKKCLNNTKNWCKDYPHQVNT